MFLFLFRYDEDDQSNLGRLIQQWPSDNRFQFNPCDEDADSQLMVVHQTQKQARLLELYGNEVTCIDATYKSTQYALPLFFLVVKTNVDYQVCFYMVLLQCAMIKFNW